MIRKPTEKDFREGTAVTVMRETKRVSIASGQGVAKGIGNAYLYFVGTIMAFGFIIAILGSLLAYSARANAVVLLGLGGLSLLGVSMYKSGRRKRDDQDGLPQIAPVAPAIAPKVAQQGTVRLDRAKLFSKAVMLAIPALITFFFMFGPMMIFGIILFAAAVLLIHRAFGDLKVLQFDHRSVRANGLLGDGELLWHDVDDIYVRTFSHFNLYAFFTSGSRRNLVIAATRNRMDGPSQLLVPIDLIELDKEGLVQLVTDLLCCRAAGGEIVPSWQRTAAPAPEPSITPASDPRDSFDPDAIMARYMAEREQIITSARPDLQPTVPFVTRKTFGRKTS